MKKHICEGILLQNNALLPCILQDMTLRGFHVIGIQQNVSFYSQQTVYCNNLKYWDRQASVNSVDPDQTP